MRRRCWAVLALCLALRIHHSAEQLTCLATLQLIFRGCTLLGGGSYLTPCQKAKLLLDPLEGIHHDTCIQCQVTEVWVWGGLQICSCKPCVSGKVVCVQEFRATICRQVPAQAMTSKLERPAHVGLSVGRVVEESKHCTRDGDNR